jgi:SAM-dependent methyltransferase
MTNQKKWVIPIPRATLNLAARTNISRLSRRLQDTPEPLLLNLGSGERFIGADCLAPEIGRRMLNFDIFAYPTTDVVGDAHLLPFAKETFHAIVCQAVLEHTRRPELVVEEMYRVLKMGGLLYVEVPFLQGYHPTPQDFYRYTLEGLDELFSKFAKIDAGVCVGPSSSVSWLLREYIAGLLTWFTPSHRLKTPAVVVAGWLTFPLKYLDFFLVRRPGAHTIASGLYFFGRKA